MIQTMWKRFDSWVARSSPRLVLSLLLLIGLTAWAAAVGSHLPPPVSSPDPENSDAGLYSAILERMSNGQPYYDAAVAEQLARGYPIQPSATVRLPTLAIVNATLGETGTYIALVTLVAAVMLLAIRRFESLADSRVEWIASLVLLVLGLTLVAAPASVYFAESWAAVLMLLALFAGVGDRWKSALALAIAAMLFRELAVLFVLAIGCLHFLRGRRRVALIWWLAAAVFVVGYLAVHTSLVSGAVDGLGPTHPPSSPGWLELGGWPLVVDFVRRATPWVLAPYSVGALVVGSALFGWALRRKPLADEFLVAALAFCVPFMVIGRPNNAYWGLLFAAMVLPGLAFTPRALWRLRPRRTTNITTLG